MDVVLSRVRELHKTPARWNDRKEAGREREDDRRRENRRGQPLSFFSLGFVLLTLNFWKCHKISSCCGERRRWKGQNGDQRRRGCFWLKCVMTATTWTQKFIRLQLFNTNISAFFKFLFIFFVFFLFCSQKSWRLFTPILSGWRLSRRPNTAASVNRSSPKMDSSVEVSTLSWNSPGLTLGNKFRGVRQWKVGSCFQ